MMIKCLVFLLLMTATAKSFSLDLSVVRKNNEGVDAYMEEDVDLHQPFLKFMDALRRDPFNPAIRINLGMVQLKNEQYALAEKDFRAALKVFGGDNPKAWQGQKSEVLPIVLFNLAVSLEAQKKKKEALHFYQRALLFNPQSKPIKTNIELLMRDMAGQGQGEGEQDDKNKDQKDKKDQKGKGKGDEKKKKPDQGQDPEKAPPEQPKKKQKFKSKELSKNDVRKFLEEIKAQEQKIRAKELQKAGKSVEKDHDKDW